MISIINYGLGNIGSIIRMIEVCGGSAEVVKSADEISRAEKLILPGVGHFDKGMTELKNRNLMPALKQRVIDDEIPILGICLGMQLLCKRSEEGSEKGLGLIEAEVKKFKNDQIPGLKIPNMGWNQISIIKKNGLLTNSDSNRRFYFVHSYYVVPDSAEITIATAYYGQLYCAAFQNKNIYGVQFHPEKSHKFGMELMRNFIQL